MRDASPTRSENFVQTVRQVLIAQGLCALGVVVMVGLATLIFSGAAAVPTLGLMRIKAVLFGSLLGIISTVITARNVLKSGQSAAEHQLGYLSMTPLFAGLLVRFMLIAGGVFVSLAYLKLAPLYVIIGYLAMQAGYLWLGFVPTIKRKLDS